MSDDVETGVGEWNKQEYAPVPGSQLTPMDMAMARVEYAGLEVEVTISAEKGTWNIEALMGRAQRAANEALQPMVVSDK